MDTTTGEIIQETAEQSLQEVGENVSGIVQYFQEHIPDIVDFGIRFLIALAIFFVGRFLIKWIRKRVKHSFARANADKGVAQFTDSFLKFALYLFLILVVAANLGINLSSITVLFASAGVGISLALQESLSNLAGGVLILLTKPFAVGDYIIEDTNHNEGTVKEIQVFYTKLTTVDNRTIVIPNGTLANGSLTNVTDKEERQLDLKIGISYHSDLKKAKLLTEHLLTGHQGILKEKGCKVFVDSLGDSAVILGARAWVRTDEYWDTRWDLLEQIKLTFDSEGIEIPFNQLTVHMEKKTD